MIFNVEAWTAVMVGQPVDAPSGDRSLAALIDRHERSYPVFATFARRMLDKQRLEETFADYFADALRWRDRACRAA